MGNCHFPPIVSDKLSVSECKCRDFESSGHSSRYFDKILILFQFPLEKICLYIHIQSVAYIFYYFTNPAHTQIVFARNFSSLFSILVNYTKVSLNSQRYLERCDGWTKRKAERRIFLGWKKIENKKRSHIKKSFSPAETWYMFSKSLKVRAVMSNDRFVR